MADIDPIEREDRSQLSSEELARRAQAGSGEAYAALVERFAAPLQAFMRVLCNDPGEAEELAQESLVRAWQRLDRYDPQRRFATWLFTLAKRIAISRWRRAGARAESSLTPDLGAPENTRGCTASDPANIAAGRDEEANLWSVAARVLTADQRSALWLLYVEELPTEEVARVLGKRPSSVRVLVFRARSRLAAELPGIGERSAPDRDRADAHCACPSPPLPWTRFAKGHR